MNNKRFVEYKAHNFVLMMNKFESLAFYGLKALCQHCQWCVLKSHYFHTSWLLKCYTDMIHCLSHDIFWIHWVLSGMHLMWQTHYTQHFKSNTIVAGKNLTLFRISYRLSRHQKVRLNKRILLFLFLIKCESDQQCQNIISWLWPNLVIACW